MMPVSHVQVKCSISRPLRGEECTRPRPNMERGRALLTKLTLGEIYSTVFNPSAPSKRAPAGRRSVARSSSSTLLRQSNPTPSGPKRSSSSAISSSGRSGRSSAAKSAAATAAANSPAYLAPDYTLNPAGPASSSTTQFKCPHEGCEKVYKGKHARSIWRRHLQDKHGIPLAQQPRRTRWDNGQSSVPFFSLHPSLFYVEDLRERRGSIKGRER